MNRLTREERMDLVMLDGVTLDGKPAGIRGFNNPYAAVGQIPSGPAFEYAWTTVKHVVENKGKVFRSGNCI